MSCLLVNSAASELAPFQEVEVIDSVPDGPANAPPVILWTGFLAGWWHWAWHSGTPPSGIWFWDLYQVWRWWAEGNQNCASWFGTCSQMENPQCCQFHSFSPYSSCVLQPSLSTAVSSVAEQFCTSTAGPEAALSHSPFGRTLLPCIKVPLPSPAAASCFWGPTSHGGVQVGQWWHRHSIYSATWAGITIAHCVLSREHGYSLKNPWHFRQPEPVGQNWFYLSDNKTYLWTDSCLSTLGSFIIRQKQPLRRHHS